MAFPKVFLDELYVADMLVDPEGTHMGLSRIQGNELDEISDELYNKVCSHVYINVVSLGAPAPSEDIRLNSSDLSKFL